MRPEKDLLPSSTRRRRSEKATADFADTLILDFPASRAVRNTCLLFKPPNLSYSVIAAQTD